MVEDEFPEVEGGGAEEVRKADHVRFTVMLEEEVFCAYGGRVGGGMDRLAKTLMQMKAGGPTLLSPSSQEKYADQHSQDLGCMRYLITNS